MIWPLIFPIYGCTLRSWWPLCFERGESLWENYLGEVLPSRHLPQNYWTRQYTRFICLFCFCSEFSKPLLPVGRAGILFSEILHLLCKQMVSWKIGECVSFASVRIVETNRLCVCRAIGKWDHYGGTLDWAGQILYLKRRMWTASSQNMWAFIRYLIYANHRNSPVSQLFHTERVIIIIDLPTETRLYTFWRLKPDRGCL